jgi:hypothetical protein
VTRQIAASPDDQPFRVLEHLIDISCDGSLDGERTQWFAERRHHQRLMDLSGNA